jgi:hypothetical protein
MKATILKFEKMNSKNMFLAYTNPHNGGTEKVWIENGKLFIQSFFPGYVGKKQPCPKWAFIAHSKSCGVDESIVDQFLSGLEQDATPNFTLQIGEYID